jgi:phenylalanyl-tRNA synthetase beta subunit
LRLIPRASRRNLQNDEINALHQRITERLVAELHIEPR